VKEDEKGEESKIAESIVLQKKEEEGKSEGAASDDTGKYNKDISKEFIKNMENGRASANKSDKDVENMVNVMNIYCGALVIMALGVYTIFSSSKKILGINLLFF
jgi:ribosomal protein L22